MNKFFTSTFTSLFSFVLLLCFLHACSSISPVANTPWQTYHGQNLSFIAEGRFSIRIDNKGAYSNFIWQNYAQDNQKITISTPLGGTIAQLCQDKQGAGVSSVFTKQASGRDINDLTQQLLGQIIPLNHLNLWANGYIAPGVAYSVQKDRLIQEGWMINRILDSNNRLQKMILMRPQITVTLIFDDFNPVRSRALPICSQ